MLSFASAAYRADKSLVGTFTANLELLPGATGDPKTMAWWQTQPDAWVHATTNPEPPEVVMPRYADWVESLPGFRVFAAAPMIFDGLWMDHYLETYAGTRVLGTPLKNSRQIFRGGGVCLYTMAGTLRGAEYLKWGMQRVPPDWYGHIEHTHRAIDDARGIDGAREQRLHRIALATDVIAVLAVQHVVAHHLPFDTEVGERRQRDQRGLRRVRGTDAELLAPRLVVHPVDLAHAPSSNKTVASPCRL